MKKTLFFAAMAAFALASCSQDETSAVHSGAGIGFRASVDKSTRANQTTLANLEAFNVTAIGNGTNYFTDMAVTSSDNGASWNSADTYYWPSYELDFFAYAPRTLAGVGIGSTAQKITDFTPASTIAGQKDVVVAYNSGTKTANEGSGVALNFKHALSQIEVKASCSNEKMKVEVLGMKICRVPSTSTFTLPAVETDASYALAQSQWTDPVTPADYSIKGASKITLTAAPQSIVFGDDSFMLIPQQLNAWSGGTSADGAYLSVLCRIYSIDGDKENLVYPVPTAQDNKDGLYGFSAVAIATNWQPGYKYTYVLDFFGANGGGGQVDPDPIDPANPTDPDIDPTPGGDGGEEILGSPIKFTVTVDAWQDAAGQDIEL